ncbi:Phosphoribosylamine--glycine ligase [Fusarium sp. Ph1]|nr:Phosphoribosylamine--glycine ligase [Fusarium sp. Ph1]
MAENLIVLLVGKGAREHALAWKLSQAPSVKKVLVFPGNAGTEQGHAKVSNLETNFEATDCRQLAELATEIGVGLVVVGPDDAVVDGIEGFFKDVGIPCFAPTKEVAELEGSKTFAKDFMAKYNIPTAAYRNFDDIESAKAYVQEAGHRVVIKADGLAAGKGVVLPETKQEAFSELNSIMKADGKFSAAGSSVVIEEFMEGDEISILTFSDGKTFRSLPPGQDHKRVFEGNKGPNTGGMGVYSPVPFATQEVLDEVDKSILQPTFDGLKKEGRPFVGLLFTGVMITPQGPKVIEYNVRFGDPETQSAMMLLSEDTDLAVVLLACTSGTLSQVNLSIRSGFACNVVVASQGYPGKYVTGVPITLQTCPKDVQVFHAGTFRDKNGCLRTGGGRVFSVAAWGSTIQEAVEAAYEGTKSVHFDGMFSRKDIASR